MGWLRCICLAVAISCFWTCSPKLESGFLTREDVVIQSAPLEVFERGGRCNQPEDFAPDLRYPEHVPVIPFEVNVHFMDSKTGENNLDEEAGRAFALEMIEKCNARLRKNVKMFLPPGNETPVIPVPWYFVLAPDPDIAGHDGIYFHEDPELYYYIHGRNSNRTSREVINTYGVRTDSVLNIFMMPHHPDSVKSPGYKAVGTGIMLGSGIKMAQIFSPSLSPESCVGLLNHEIGHALGLSHTWAGNDGCEDTPTHPNCWYHSDTPPCDSLVSNNLMDYNAWQHAVTPCQIGRVLRNVTNLSSRVRKFARPDWCTYDSAYTITIRDSIHWRSPRDLTGNILIAERGVLMLSCRLSLAAGARITVAVGGTLILDGCRIHNACGGQWAGIEIMRKGKVKGVVEIAATPQLDDVVHTIDFSGD